MIFDVKERYSGIQTVFKNCNLYGCHFLTLLSIAEESNNSPIDLIEAIRISQSKDWINSDFELTEKTALSLLKYFTNKEWTRREVKKLPTIQDNEFTEVIYFNKRTGYHHYRRRGFDTLANSITVQEGVIEKYYIYTRKD